MKRALLLALLLCSSAAQATIAYDSTACAGGAIASCPTSTTLASAGTTATATTAAFSTTANNGNMVAIFVTGHPAGTSPSLGTPVCTGCGTPIIAITSLMSVCATTFACSGIWYFYPPATGLSGITIAATLTSGSAGNDVQVVVIPFGSPVVMGRGGSQSAGATITLSLAAANGLQGSLFMGTFTDGNSATARTANATSTLMFNGAGSTTDYLGFLIASSPLATQGAVATIGTANPPATVSGSWEMSAIEMIDASIVARPDMRACGTNFNGGAVGAQGTLNGCPGSTGTTTSRVTGSFSLIKPVELICVTSAAQGVGVSAVTISDSGILKTNGNTWSLVGTVSNGLTNHSDIWCAITTAAVAAKTITVAYTATSIASSVVKVYPYYTSETSFIPANFQSGATTGGPVAITITPSASGSHIIGVGVDTADTSTRTAFSPPQGWIVASLAGTTGYAFAEYAWSTAATLITFGTSSPNTGTVWALGALEIPLASGSTCSSFGHFWCLEDPLLPILAGR